MIERKTWGMAALRPVATAEQRSTGAETYQHECFEAGILAQLDALFRVALRMTGHIHDAEDLVQETVARALARRAQFTPGSNLRAWLFTIERSIYINAYHSKRRTPPLQSLDEVEEAVLYGVGGASPSSSAETVLLRDLASREIRAALDTLPRHYRLAVHLTDVVGLSYAEVAQTMGCALGTVMSRVHRGRALLRQTLTALDTSPGTPDALGESTVDPVAAAA